MKKIVVYGYGMEGKSTEKFFEKKSPSIQIKIIDDGNKETISLEAKKEIFEWAEKIFVSPGIDRKKNIPEKFLEKCTSQIEYFFQQIPEEKRKKVIGVTGSKGKSTTTKLIHEFLDKSHISSKVCGNFGIPFLDILDDFLADDFEYLVAEVSSFQAEYLKSSPGIAVFLSFFLDHLDRHENLENYFEAKKNVWKFQSEADFLLLPKKIQMNPNFDLIIRPGLKNQGALHFFEALDSNYFPEGSTFHIQHFLENFGVLFSLSKILKLKDAEKIIRETTQDFQGLPHRVQFVGEKLGIKFYNDSIATNPDAVLGSLEFFRENLNFLIVGGQSDGGNFEILIEKLQTFPRTTQILMIDSTFCDRFKQAENFLDFSGSNNYKVVQDLSEAFQIIQLRQLEASKKTGQRGDKNSGVCLFSPGAKSFDQYKNYPARGQHFIDLVGRL